jgi:transcription factor Dp-1
MKVIKKYAIAYLQHLHIAFTQQNLVMNERPPLLQGSRVPESGLDPDMVRNVYAQFAITEDSICSGDQAVAEALEVATRVWTRIPHVEGNINTFSRAEEEDRRASIHNASSSGIQAPTSPSASTQSGLKHFTLRLCELIEKKQRCTYTVISDALLSDLKNDYLNGVLEVPVEEKNVRRRVYDALNVLDAIGVVKKESSKVIQWIGWPRERNAAQQIHPHDTKSAQCAMVSRLQAKRSQLLQRVQQRLSSNQESAVKLFCLSNLILRNKDAPLPLLLVAQDKGIQTPNPFTVPFMMILAPPDAHTDVRISEDCRHAELDFNNAFYQVFDDMGVMQMMGLGEPNVDLLQ